MTSNLFDLSGRVALIVGASRGIGRAIARGLAEAGASVALCSRTQRDLLQAAEKIRAGGARAEIFPADVARVDDIHWLVREVRDRMEQIDIVVNVAGVNRRKPSIEITEEDWDTVLDLNLKGLFFTCQAWGGIRWSRAVSPPNTIEARVRLSTSAALPARWAFAMSRPIRRAKGRCSE